MDIFLLYLWTRLDVLRDVFVIMVVFSGVCAASCVFLYIIEFDAKLGLWMRKFVVVFIISMLGLMSIPTSKDVAIIIAGTATYRAMTSERGSRLATAFADYIEEQALSILKRKETKRGSDDRQHAE